MDVADYAERVKAGDVRAVSRLMTWIENDEPRGRAILQRLRAPDRSPVVIVITGYPGAGKSTLIDQLTTAYRREGRTVGILAVDASSPRTGGAILGDRIRMQDHTGDPAVFIRSMGTRGHHGGLARTTQEAAVVLAAAGYEVVLIETVGVGQDVGDLTDTAHAVVAVVAPGLGDEVQAMKAGLLEVADIVVVNKGDREHAQETMRDLQAWIPTVLRTIAVKGEGVPEVLIAIEHTRRQRKD